MLGRRATDRVIFFAKGNLDAFSIDFRSRGDYHWFMVTLGRLQHTICAAHIGADGMHWTFYDQLHTDCRRQMIDDVALGNQTIQDHFIKNRVDRILK